MNVGLQFQYIDNNFLISANGQTFFVGDKLYFIGKLGSAVDEYRNMILSHAVVDEDLIEILTISGLKLLEKSDKYMIIYIDTPFIEKYDSLIAKGFEKEVIKAMMEKEKDQFENIDELLKDLPHLIIQ